jgi:hypothetical protein
MKRIAFPVLLLLMLVAFSLTSDAQNNANYDESQVPAYTLPELLTLQNGKKVTSTKAWNKERRPEILKLFETNVYGRTMVGRPKEMTWEVVNEKKTHNDSAIEKTVTIYFAGKKEGPKMDLKLVLPARAAKPVPVFLIPMWSNDESYLIAHGYGSAVFMPGQVELDKKDKYDSSIRKFYAQPGQDKPGSDEWGAIGAWAWAMSRAMDYLETDKAVDAKKVCIMGFSRYGKVAMWAGAQDQRFAVVVSGESGCGGAVIVRRGYGETLRTINKNFPYWFNDNFKTYNERVNELPVDWHMMIALMAPRPVYVATAEGDQWGDPKGSFLSAKYAQPVYDLFKEGGVGVAEMPSIETPVGDFIGYHNRTGKHGITRYDWEQFVKFADTHLKR